MSDESNRTELNLLPKIFGARQLNTFRCPACLVSLNASNTEIIQVGKALLRFLKCKECGQEIIMVPSDVISNLENS